MVSMKNLVMGIAIFLLTMFVGIYGIRAMYGKEPQYDKFCPYLINQSICEANNGTWLDNTQYVVDVQGRSKPIPAEGRYCQYDSTICQKNFDDAREEYQKKVFFIAAPLGVIIIAIGALIFGLEFVGAGLMAGGVGVIFYGVMGYWEFTTDWFKFIILLVGLIVVIYIGYYLNKRIGKLGFGKFGKKKHDDKRE